MKTTVVIVTYNRLELLKECIYCTINQTLHFDNIVIVDNNSTDGTRDYLKSFTNQFHIIFEKENGGGAKGFKDGIEYAHKNLNSDWILVIDDDAMLSPDYLQNIAIGLVENNECKAFSGSVETDGEIDVTHRKRLIKNLKFNIVPVAKDEYKTKYFEYDLSSFCGLVFHTSLIETIGYPKAEYFIWYDDSEYSLRIREESKIINVNSAIINHKTKIYTKSETNWKGYYGVRNSGDMIKNHGCYVQFVTFYLKIKLAQYKNSIKSLICKDSKYSYMANLYRDAMKDLQNKRLGFNPKYHA